MFVKKLGQFILDMLSSCLKLFVVKYIIEYQIFIFNDWVQEIKWINTFRSNAYYKRKLV